MEQDKPEVEDQQECERLANEVESRLREYLDKAAKEYPPGCQADWLSGVAAERLLAESSAGCTATPVSLVKLSIYLMESLADVSNAYEEFYAQQVAELREDGLAAHAQVASLEDENARLREQLHRRAEELRLAQAAAETLKSTASGGDSSAGVVGRHRFDEAVDVEDEDEVEEEVAEEAEAVRGAAAVAAAACGSSGGAVCRQCGRGGGDAESAAAATKAAVQIAALKADLADWEADMAEKVHQNVELAAQLEACQRQLARQAARAAA
uniref:RH1 domain-containing protein n=1 Tax=Macrostomum lignano TaxID=282301 RepID=A0A1I8G999_9PLAT